MGFPLLHLAVLSTIVFLLNGCELVPEGEHSLQHCQETGRCDSSLTAHYTYAAMEEEQEQQDSQMDLDEGPQIENMECDTSEITADSTQPTTDVNTPDSKNDAPTIPDKLTKDGTMEVSESEQSCTTSQDATLSEQKLTKLGNKDGNSVTEQQSKDTPTLPQEPNVPSDTRDDTESEQKPGIDGQPSEGEGVSSVVGTQNESEKESEVKSKDSAAVAMVMEDNKDEEEEDYTFPDSLEGFGYHFVGDRLQNIESGEGFVFEVKKGNKRYNQLHYEALGEVITLEVYKLLEEAGLQRVNIPSAATKNCSFFFMTEDAQISEKLMVLIHGSGVVRAGQWARSLIINDCLESGTQLPYIREANKLGYGVIVTNTNENTRRTKEGGMKQLKESGTPEQHADYVWQNYIKKAKAQHIDIVAHSYGGVVAVNLVNTFFNDFKKRVKKMAFTDSVHTYNPVRMPPQKWAWLAGRAVNWVSSDEPLDTPLLPWEDNVQRVSAGTPKHVETSWKSMKSIFDYFQKEEDKGTEV